jgi:type II secretory ATPase GspE/PulE/Tfp pilus assembly ATPase PilB-like protein
MIDSRFCQVQVNPQIDVTFSNALRTILRQDPDIIMVGEIRDADTANMAVQAALTGHLVFSTLHTRNAAGAVTRLVELGVEPFLLSSVLRGVVAQRLIRRICTRCAVEGTLEPRSGRRARPQGAGRAARAADRRAGARAASTAARPACTAAPACSRCSTSASACAR